MLTVSTPTRKVRKKGDRYHHGDLSRALVQATLRTIQRDGVEAVTLRGVGEDVGVSRTALYRHFADKSALLRAVAREGFRMLRLALVDAIVEQQGAGLIVQDHPLQLALYIWSVVHGVAMLAIDGRFANTNMKIEELTRYILHRSRAGVVSN